MQTIFSITELRKALGAERRAGKRIGFVPTMGNLHDGHIQLIHQSNATADITVASIFVNPLQFGENEDLDAYPRTLQSDSEKLAAADCDYLFAPNIDEMYPNGQVIQTQVEVPVISDLHCGTSRPGHFRGVATVVCKLFGMVQPDVAIFGEKDFQQLMVIRRMTEDLFLPVEVQGSPIARADNGLALSSRNGYLTPEELAIAPTLNRTIRNTISQIKAGRTDYSALQEEAQAVLEEAGFSRDYYNICNRYDLQAAKADDSELVLVAAAYLGKARLIDNMVIDL
ncbi:pantoate--beta-alanine ligase [Amphritea balenae]|uniref:Pantothenate synthetase n=1 Tax=Amphritea balenae TaxID=452629 RepID=A0A3P1SJN1_9GAMM|nr:pantoate--beta-alanine ligase [Amphritea balenae]RRC96945.1 pantoate--beta-alanine ligase [Amphritea balenae]GGK85449.1 pantothenate synthetase [Amphritea balenae]